MADTQSVQTMSLFDNCDELSDRTLYAASFLSLLEDRKGEESNNGITDPSDPCSDVQKRWAVRRALKAELDGIDRVEERLRKMCGSSAASVSDGAA